MAEDIKDEPIDLDKLRPRELLILLAKDVKEIKTQQAEHQREQHAMAIKLNTLETKSRIWGGVLGFFSGLLSGFGVTLFSK